MGTTCLNLSSKLNMQVFELYNEFPEGKDRTICNDLYMVNFGDHELYERDFKPKYPYLFYFSSLQHT